MKTPLTLPVELTTTPPADADMAELCFAKEKTATDYNFKAEAGDTLVVHLPAHNSRLILAGLGPRGQSDLNDWRRAAAACMRVAREARARKLFARLPDTAVDSVRVACEGAILGVYDNNFYKKADEDAPHLESVSFIVENITDELRGAVERGRIVAESANWARELVDEPGNKLPPAEFARRAAEMAAEFGLTVETLGPDEIQRRGMGGLWGIGKGSDNPPQMIVARYEPENAEGGLWAFVGKGITFDTGGIDIKPPLKMEEMKGDMGGGAAALGALRALAQLKPRQRVVAIVPAAENMPSEKSIKPGDIVNTLAGYTLEVVDTDAEGRVALSDGIAYAKELGAARIVDLATLTGSIIVALGAHRAGLFSNNDEWAAAVYQAAERAGEPVWRLPVSDDYKKLIESNIADFKNYGKRPDATGAALLLSKFAGDTPWAHLDIAGTAWQDETQPHAPAGATGAGVRTLVELVLGR
jgi:leucyl aminopeptidase